MTEVVKEMKYYEDPAPSDTPTSEGAFETKGKAALAAVDALTSAWAAITPSKAGDSDGGAIKDFAPWFSELQDKLTASVQWSETHEEAHRLLYRYAVWKVGMMGINPIPPNAEFLFRFLGKAEDNQPPINKLNSQTLRRGGVLMTESSTFFGTPGAPAWCAPASSIPIQKVLERFKIYLMDGGDPQGTWAKKTNPKVAVSGAALESVELTPGDYIRVVTHSGPLSGHIATVLKAVPSRGETQTIWYVSGNAGRYGGGAVRIDSVTRERPPAGYDYGRVSDLGNDRNTLKADIKKQQEDIDAARAVSHWDDKRFDDVSDANQAADAHHNAMQQRIDRDQARIARDQAQIAKDDQDVMAEARKARPGENPANVEAAEKMLRPSTRGMVWLTYVATTGKMDLHALKPSSDPSMKAWMKQWRAADHRSK